MSGYLMSAEKYPARYDLKIMVGRVVGHDEATLQSLHDTLPKNGIFGGKAPDMKVVDMNGDEHNLLDFMKQDRPLVLNFGSCS
ncbi:unnamed protein product [Clavelina lepadiformis]|uniref:Iodothyronine deiodinase n=1 Tax=Clavelina lepadiformis TaxID=159417 RepID=A0ABP0EXH4_CLALP